MKILHTSDWHVGRTIRGRSRAGEHEAVLAEICTVAEREAVDLVVVAGDLFDTAAPSPEAERLVYRALLDLAGGSGGTPRRPVVAVAGNHDNERRLQAVAPLLALGGVLLQPFLAPPEEGGVVTVTAADGTTAAVALLPFPSQRHIVKADHLMGLDPFEHAGQYAERVQRVIAALTAGFSPDAVNLVVAHLTVTGATVGGGERSAHTIFDYWVPATAFPASAHYVALGHLHRAQAVPAPCPAWYSGSPLHLDFGETVEPKAVLLIDAAPGRPASVAKVALAAGRRLRTLRATLADLRPLAGNTGDDWLRVVVRERARAGMSDEVRDLFPEAVDVVVERPDEQPGRGSDRDIAPRLGRSPAELFAEYLAEQGTDDDRVLALFAEVLEDALSAGAGGGGGGG